MICEHCGTDYVVVGQHDGDRVSPWHTHTAEKCRDMLKAKLAECERERDQISVAKAELFEMWVGAKKAPPEQGACEHCGTEHAEEGYDESETVEAVWSCRNALKAKVTEMKHERDTLCAENASLRKEFADIETRLRTKLIGESEARVRELEADVERLRDAVQLEISQRRVDDSYGRDKSACQTVSDILERRGNDFGLMSALAASASAGEQQKTSEGDVGREDNSSAPNSTSPPAEAPSRAGVPSGKAGCRACDPLNPGDVGEPHTCSPQEGA